MSFNTALVTGCSTGIGRALALELHRRGLRVVATARRLDDLTALQRQGIDVAALDVDSPESIRHLMTKLEREDIGVDLLVNNAGYGAMGPLAEMPVEAIRRQFQTNVFSLMAVTQALLPGMIAQRCGCIVNVGSISGITTTPFSGAYCASKAAVHALSDALRMELAPLGIHVVTAQPGGIRSQFGANATSRVAGASASGSSLYAALRQAIDSRAGASQRDAMPAEEFARRLADAVLVPRPPAVVRAGKHSRLLPALSRWLPTHQVDALLSRRFGLDRLRPS